MDPNSKKKSPEKDQPTDEADAKGELSDDALEGVVGGRGDPWDPPDLREDPIVPDGG